MVRRIAALVAALCLVLGGYGLAQDDQPSKLACPQCGKGAEGEKCAKDGSPLVASELVAFHAIVLELGKAPALPNGLANPFKGCVKDGDVDVAAVEKLVADYKAARAKATFNDVNVFNDARLHGNEAAAIGALKTICTSEAIFREGDKDENGELDYGDLAALAKAKLIDKVLGSGKKQGYVFECHPSTNKKDSKNCFCWWATASPIEPGKTGNRYFFTNEAGVIYYSTKPIELDDEHKESCEPPAGLKPVGR